MALGKIVPDAAGTIVGAVRNSNIPAKPEAQENQQMASNNKLFFAKPNGA